MRTRLTLWYVSVLGTLLVLALSSISLLFFFQLRSQLDRFNVEELETVEGLLYFTGEGNLRLRDDYHNHPHSKDRIESFLEVYSTTGSVLFRNERLGPRDFDDPVGKGEGVGGYFERSKHLSDGTPVRMVSRAHILNGKPLLIRLAHTEEHMRSGLEKMFLASIFVCHPF